MRWHCSWTTALGAVTLSAACNVTALQNSAQPSAQQRPAPTGGLTDVDGLRVGQHTLTERPTGCTVILVEGEGAVGGISQRGAAPGTRETDLLDPLNTVDRVNAVVLTGGSAYGLDAAQGVVRFLEERKVGYPIAGTVVPIVPAAVLMDLGFGGSSTIRPTADCGYRAATAASKGAIAEGNIGAGAGATVGKTAGRARAMKGGIGTASITLPNGLVVAAIAAVNSVGDVIDPSNGAVVAGVRSADGKSLADARKLLRAGPAPAPSRAGENTTLALVATNAVLSKADINRVALMADDGLARAVIPSHTSGDGDTVFALATGRWQGQADASMIGALAADMLAEAIVRAAAKAAPLGGLPAARDLGSVPARLR
jgi:L-aminopeptidase/D-esterase-like protein